MSANEPSNSIPPADAQFIFECLRNFDDDRQVNLGQVASALGYSNVASVGNRLRAVRKTYGFENLMGKNTAMGAKTSQPVVAATKEQNGDGQKPKRGRPARAKNIKPDGTSPASSAEVAPRVEVSSKTTNEETKPSKRKREDNNDEIKDDKTKTTEQPQQPKKRGRKPAALAAPISATTSASSATMPPTASAPASASTGPMNGSGKANPSIVHFNHIGEPSKRRKKQEDTNSTPSKRIYYTAAETIREARRQRRGRRGSLESGLKLVLKVAQTWW